MMTQQPPTRTSGVRPIHEGRHAARVAVLQAAAPAWPHGYDRQTGEKVWHAPSLTEPNLFHTVTADGCSCKGYAYRGRCSHHSALVGLLGVHGGKGEVA